MKPKYIILHHSATADGWTLSADDIRRYHMEVNGWKDVGYHFFIERVEDSTQILAGRMLDEDGAHCVGRNHDSIGICFVGNFDIADPPQASWDAGVRLVRSLCRVFGIPPENVGGHRDYAEKTCPGIKFDLDKFRNALKEV